MYSSTLPVGSWHKARGGSAPLREHNLPHEEILAPHAARRRAETARPVRSAENATSATTPLGQSISLPPSSSAATADATSALTPRMLW